MSAKIDELTTPMQGWRYHSDCAVYTERWRDGRLIAAALHDSGVPWHPRDEAAEVAAFDLTVDGEALYFGWELAASAVTDGEIPAATLSLRHSRQPVELEIVTRATGDGFFQRRMTLSNVSTKRALGLTSVTPFRGELWPMKDCLRENLLDGAGVPYRVGWMQDVEWGHEGNFQWQPVPLNTELAFGSELGRSGHTTPFAVGHNEVEGGWFVAGLAWSANWRMTFRTAYSRGSGEARLQVAAMPVAPAPMRVLGPGEKIVLPEVWFGVSHGSYEEAIQGWHRQVRRAMPRPADGRQPVIYNHWGYMEGDLTEAGLYREIDIAAEIGAELFMVDAGWYSNSGEKWYLTSGDWQTGDRLPNGLEPIFDRARARGLQVGLWVELESAGKESRLAQEHPDWFISRYGQPVERVLDLSKAAVASYLEETVIRLIERYRLDMFRLDYNLSAREGGFNECAGRLENTLWRHVEAIHGIFDRARERFPGLHWENCSSGGGRTDLGMASRFTTMWVSDHMRLPRTVRILNGMSQALPPETVNRLFGVCMNGSYRGSVETQLHAIVLGHPAISGLTPSLAEANPALLAQTKKYVRLYKEFIRPFHRESRVYHHTPVLGGPDGSGWCAIEMAAADRCRAVAGVFRLVNAAEDEYRLRWRGLDSSRRYRVIAEPGGQSAIWEGAVLAEQGLTIRLDTPLSSRLLLIDAID